MKQTKYKSASIITNMYFWLEVETGTGKVEIVAKSKQPAIHW